MSGVAPMPGTPRLTVDAGVHAVPLIASGGLILAVAGEVTFILSTDQAVALADALLEAATPEDDKGRAGWVLAGALERLGLTAVSS